MESATTWSSRSVGVTPTPTRGRLLPYLSIRLLHRRPIPTLPPPRGTAAADDRSHRVAAQRRAYKLVPDARLGGLPLVPGVPTAGWAFISWLFRVAVVAFGLSINAFLAARRLRRVAATSGNCDDGSKGPRRRSVLAEGVDAVAAAGNAGGVAAAAAWAAVGGTREGGVNAVRVAVGPLGGAFRESESGLAAMAASRLDGQCGQESGISLAPTTPDAAPPGATVCNATTSSAGIVIAGEAAAAAAVDAGLPARVPSTTGGGGVSSLAADAFADYRSLFATRPLPAVAAVGDSDDFFARLRVAGPNPMGLRAATAADLDDPSAPLAPVTDAHLRQVAGFDSDTLSAAAADGRLYVVSFRRSGTALAAAMRDHPSDNAEMDGSADGKGRERLFAPVALFAIPPGSSADAPGRLAPVAIAVGGPNAAATPRGVFTPADGAAWAAAKLIVNAADGTEHELREHLGLTHLLINGIAAVTFQELEARAHPLWRLLTPHYDGTFFLNSIVPDTLLAPGGGVELLLPASSSAQAAYVAGVVRNTPFNSRFPRLEMGARGVLNAALAYPYRDDALELYDILHDYVAEYVAVYYRDDKAVQEDYELQAWAAAVSAPDGAGVAGFGETAADGSTAVEGAILTIRYLVDALTLIIFTASVQHAALNFPQSDIMTWVPVFPLAVRADAPTAEDAAIPSSGGTAARRWLPPPAVAAEQIFLGGLLGGVVHLPLGSLPWTPRSGGWFRHPAAAAAVTRLRCRLRGVEARIGAREKGEVTPYEYLRPSRVPRSINI
ncbi:hypothetical protein MMPV_007130 [Pyropia vietnamensis]